MQHTLPHTVVSPGTQLPLQSVVPSGQAQVQSGCSTMPLVQRATQLLTLLALVQHSWLAEHTVPQAPQLALLVRETQLPLQQVVRELQAIPQPPQLLLSVCRFLQVAFVPLPQQVSPAAQQVPLQVGLSQTQAPLRQLCPEGQTLLQLPQWEGLVVRSTQVPEQLTWPLGQHMLPERDCP